MAEEARGQEWEYKHIPDLTGGLNLSVRSDKLEDGELLQANNIMFELDRIRIDTGYLPFHNPVRGIPRGAFQFFKKNGDSDLILVTNDTLYFLLLDQWQYIRGDAFTSTTSPTTEGGTALTVSSITGFSNGDHIGVALDNGKQHQTTIDGAPSGSTINIVDPVPIGRSVPTSATVVRAVVLSGSDDIAVSAVTLPFVDWFVFTNGVDNPKRFDGTDCLDVPNLPSSGNLQCKVVGLFSNFLVLLNTVEGGTAFPQRVRWSDTADPTEWILGNAGFKDMYQSEDFITAGAPLGPYFMIYKERSLIRMEFVGSVDKLFHFEPIISGEGTFSQDGVVNLGDFHMFLGNANIYKYSGGYSIEPRGDKVFHRLFGVRGELNPEFKHRSFAFYVEELDEVWIFFPAGNSVRPNKVVRWRQEVDSWSDRIFDRDMAGFGFYLAVTDRPWSGLVGSWLQQTWKWNSVTVLANSPITLLCDSVNQVFVYDYLEPLDNGNPIRYFFETKDFTNPQFSIRVDEIHFRTKGKDVLVEYSTDSGQSWQLMGLANQASGALFSETRLHKQFIAKRVRFRFSGTSGGFAMEWLTIKHSLESEQ